MEYADATIRSALTYVCNTNGGAKRMHFIDDHAPIGCLLWKALRTRGYVAEAPDTGAIFVTEAGKKFLSR